MLDGPMQGLASARKRMERCKFDSLMAFRRFDGCRRCSCSPPRSPAAALAQSVVVFVNGEPITAIDIEQRSKLIQLSTQKVASAQEVLDQLIDEKLKMREAKRWGIDVTDTEVDSSLRHDGEPHAAYGRAVDPELGEAGVNVQHAQSADQGRHRLAAAGPRPLSVEPADRRQGYPSPRSNDERRTRRRRLRLHAAADPVPGAAGLAGRDLSRRRKREAEALRGRFKGCAESIPIARAHRDVAVRDQVIRTSADLPAELRKVLDSVPVGQLTPPEVTRHGIEMFAVCSKKKPTADNSPGKRQAAREPHGRSASSSESKRYLQSCVATR